MDIKAISNAGPIIHLTIIGKLSLLKELFGKIAIPEAVKIEVIEKGKAFGKPDAILIEKEIGDWLEIVKNPEIKKEISEKSGIHFGELAVILIAKELNLPALIDDAAARSFAEVMGIEVVGSIGCLIKATKDGLISNSEALLALEQLSEVMWLNAQVYERARKSIQALGK
jgi:predicted nucleic acid-binding protein